MYCTPYHLLNHLLKVQLSAGEESPLIKQFYEQRFIIGHRKEGDGYFRITPEGEEHLKREKSRLRVMKQSEKLDLLLKELYKYRDDGNYYDITELLQEIGIYYNEVEAMRLGNRLIKDGLVDPMRTIGQLCLQIESHGIDYCEESSYSKPGFSIVSNYTVSGNTFTVTGSTNTNFNLASPDSESSQKLNGS